MNKVPKERVILENNNVGQEELINIVRNANLKSDKIKQKVIECLESPNETKQRIILLLKQIYHKIYKEQESIIESIIKKKVVYYEELYKKDYKKFCKDLLKTDYAVFGNKVMVHISYFWNIDFWYRPNNKGDELIILGINTNQLYELNPKEKIYNFLKTISDKTRLEIIDLLSERKWYVNELAEKLNVSTATISYHLSRLQDLNIVDFKREDQRFYYYLIKSNLKNYFKEASIILLKE